MKINLIVILISIVSFTPAQTQNNVVKIIEQTIQSINKDTNYQLVTLYNEAFLDTGFIKQPGKGYGELTSFFKNGTIYKIREKVGVKSLQKFVTTEYYYSNNKLIFVDEKEELDFEGKYYFDNDKIIETTTKGKAKTILLPNEEYFHSQSKEGQLLMSSQKHFDLLIKKN